MSGFVRRSLHNAGRIALISVLGVLACAALLRVLAGLLEAAALLLTAAALAAVVTPRGIRLCRHFVRRDIPILLDRVLSRVQSSPQDRASTLCPPADEPADYRSASDDGRAG